MTDVVCFDLEGPLSPQDNAYELLGLVEDGRRIFEVISRYDDILTLEGRRGYEPGDTLSLIIPFLVSHGISDRDIAAVSARAPIVDGVEELLSVIKKDWNAYIISTSYRPHAFSIAGRLGIPKDRVYATDLDLEGISGRVRREDLKLVYGMEEVILSRLEGAGDVEIKKTLDGFYRRISKTSLGALSEVKVVGGVRKLHALEIIAKAEGRSLSEVVVVGDSITDFKMLEAVRRENGAAVVFNGNRYALPYGNIGLACSSMLPLLVVLNAFAMGGTEKAMDAARVWHIRRGEFLADPAGIPEEYAPQEVRDFLVGKKHDKKFLQPCFSCLQDLSDDERQKLIELHSKARKHVRGKAGNLG